MKRTHLRIRLWTASILFGCTASYSLTLMMSPGDYGYYLPGTQPGWLLVWAASAVARKSMSPDLKLAIVTVGNALFYTWLALRILVADLLSRGRLGRLFLGHSSHSRSGNMRVNTPNAPMYR